MKTAVKPQKQNRLPSVLGLSLGDGQLRACRAVRAKGGIEFAKTASATLALDVLSPDAELVGREIKNHLEAAGIREKHVVVAVPPRWIMTQHAKVPELSPEDSASFLALEAEKGFPVDPDQLQIAQSFQRTSAGNYVTQLAVRTEQLDQLTKVLKAAGLKPVSFSLGLAVLNAPPAAKTAVPPGVINVAVDTDGVTLLVTAGGGIAALRTLEASIDTEAGEKLVNGAAVSRELRITLEQLPPDLRAGVTQLALTGDSTMARQLAERLKDWAAAAGLAITRHDLPEKNLGAEIAHALAGRFLTEGALTPEFLPPRPSKWSVLVARYSSKRLATVGYIAAAAAVAALGAFGWQEYRRWNLRTEWAGMQAQVTQLEGVQARIREFRPWYDTSFQGLTTLKKITECFPDNNSVTAKSIEVHGNLITISGSARDKAALLRAIEQIRKLREVTDQKTEQIRTPANGPAQFTFTFRWNSGAGS